MSTPTPDLRDAKRFLTRTFDNVQFSKSAIDNMHTGLLIAMRLSHALAAHAGWWKPYDESMQPQYRKYFIGTQISLIHSEISEALEGYRKTLTDTHLPHRSAVEVELADAVIRIFDTADKLGLDVPGALIEKLFYNAHRNDHKLEVRANGGKAF